MTNQTPTAIVPRQRGGAHLRAAVPGGLTAAGLFTLLLGAALGPIDFFVVNVALPTIDRDLHASTAALELIVAGYGIAYAVLLVLGGRLGDAFGRRRLFMLGLAGFTVTSLVCGLAPGVDTLVAARIAQGAAAAMMLPQVLATVQATTTGARRARAIGRYGAMAGISTMVGQLVGGLLVSADIAGTGWRPIFLVNVPIGLAGLVLASRTVPATRSDNPARTDLAGTALLATALLALLIPLTEGSALGWPVWSWVLLAAVPVAATAFAVVERRIENGGRMPLLPPSLLRLPSMRHGLTVAVPFFAGFGGFMFVYALAMQDGLRLGPLGSGLALTPMALTFFVGSMLSPRLIARLGRRSLTVGTAVQATGFAMMVPAVLFGWTHHATLLLVPGMVVGGFGQALGAMTIFRVVLADVPADRAGAGSGILTTTQQSSLALGATVLGTVFADLAAPGALGIRYAFAIAIAANLAAVIGIAAYGTRLPDPRR
jgi:MFS family permease